MLRAVAKRRPPICTRPNESNRSFRRRWARGSLRVPSHRGEVSGPRAIGRRPQSKGRIACDQSRQGGPGRRGCIRTIDWSEATTRGAADTDRQLPTTNRQLPTANYLPNYQRTAIRRAVDNTCESFRSRDNVARFIVPVSAATARPKTGHPLKEWTEVQCR